MKTLLSFLSTCLSFFVVSVAHAQSINPVTDTGLGASGRAAGLTTEADLPTRVGQLLQGAIGVIGIIFLVLTVYGGFRIMLSRGEADGIKKGRETILYGVLGMIVVAAAYAITGFVFTQLLIQ
jgi:hypothetical protein